MSILIRPERSEDFSAIRRVVKAAFDRPGREASLTEWDLIESIRSSKFYLPDLSLVAELDSQVVGHIMFTPMTIQDGRKEHHSLALGPVAVSPSYQNQGIGHSLINEGIARAKILGYGSIIVLGHPNYYTKFGFQEASRWKIGLDANFSSDYLFALELKEGELDRISGIVKYCDPFYGDDGELV